MAHINGLDPEVLYRILWLASDELAKDIDEWKLKLTLLQVCTKWYSLFKSYVFSQGFVGIYSLKRNENPYIDMKSCVYYADSDIVCRSNLGIITGRDEYNCDCVAELDVGIDCMLTMSMYGHILQKFSMIGIGYWLNLNSLKFDSALRTFTLSKSAQPNLEELAVTASHYIHECQDRLSNIIHSNLFIEEDKTVATAFWIIIEHYAPQLQYLSFNHPIGQKTLPLFSTELTSLTLSLSNLLYQNTSFYAKPLQFLQFFNMSSSKFSWWLFHGFATPGYIELSNLKTLHLSYNEQTDEEKKLSEKHSKQTRPYGTHMLRFPKLESLKIRNSPVDCDVLFTDTIPTHLKKLEFQGSRDSLVASSRLIFTNVNDLTIALFTDESLVDDLYCSRPLFWVH